MQQAQQQQQHERNPNTPRRRWHTERFAEQARVRRHVRRMRIFGAGDGPARAKAENVIRKRRLRPWHIDGEDLYVPKDGRRRPLRGAWALLGLIASVTRSWRDSNGELYEAIQLPWRVLAKACGVSADQIGDHVVPWLVAEGLIERVYWYDRASDGAKLRRRDGTHGTRLQTSCILWLTSEGDALVRHRAEIIAARAARRAARKISDPNALAFAFSKANAATKEISSQDPTPGCVEGAPAAPAGSIVHVQRHLRRLPDELRHRQRPESEGAPATPARRQGQSQRARRGEGAIAPAEASKTIASVNASPAIASAAPRAAADPPTPARRSGGRGGSDGGGDDRDRVARLALRAMRGDAAAAAELAELAQQLEGGAQLDQVPPGAAPAREHGRGATPAPASTAPRRRNAPPPAPPLASEWDACTSEEDEEKLMEAQRARGRARGNSDPVGMGAVFKRATCEG